MRCSHAALAGLALAWPVLAEVAPGTGHASPQSLNLIPGRRQVEVAREGGAELSKLFTALASPRVKAEVALSPEQADLIGRLDVLTRDIVRGSLILPADNPRPRPGPGTAGQGISVRDRLIAHAEAIAVEGILTPRQSGRLKKASDTKASPLLPPVAGPVVARSADDESTTAELVLALRDQAASLHPHAGRAFSVLLGRQGRVLGIELTKEQADLIGRLDALTVTIFRRWLTRGLDSDPLPRRAVLAQRRWEGGERVRDRLFAHAAAIALQGIITKEQAERVLSVVWRQMGPWALLDPELASRLRLSKAQRQQVLLLLRDRTNALDEFLKMDREIGTVGHQEADRPSMVQQIHVEAGITMSRYDDLIWDVLTDAQKRALSRITARKPAQPAMVERKELVRKRASLRP